MSNNKTKKQSYLVVLASVKEEMAEPRVAASAKTGAESQSPTTVKAEAKT
jgi:hypothetical protein